MDVHTPSENVFTASSDHVVARAIRTGFDACRNAQLGGIDKRIIEIERVYYRKEVPACLRDRVEAARQAA
jgi:hypothetical protein